MALWNDRDNRWIVNELKDGKNVNSWHWDEKNITKQFENKLKELIIQKEIIKNTHTHIKIIITKLNLFKGEINIVNRKGKKKLQYEFETELEGLFIDESVTETVKIKLPDIYDEPFSDSSQLPTLLVSQLASSHVKVCLSGEYET